jgi:hypothetical protein
MSSRNEEYFPHYSYGRILYDPRKSDPKLYEPWWSLVMCDRGIIDFYSWLCLKWGMPIDKATAWGPHISWIKGEEPINKHLWGFKHEKIKFYYSNIVRCDNKMHAWLDVWCPQLWVFRKELGLPEKAFNFHLTLGRLR